MKGMGMKDKHSEHQLPRAVLAAALVLALGACTRTADEPAEKPAVPVTTNVEPAREISDEELRRYVRASYRVGNIYRAAEAGRKAAFASGDQQRIERTETLFMNFLLEAVAVDGFDPSRYEAIRRRLGSDPELLAKARRFLEEEVAKLPHRRGQPLSVTEIEGLVRGGE